MGIDLTVHVSAPNGESLDASAPPDYKTGQFLKDFLSGFRSKGFRLSEKSDWSFHDKENDRHLDNNKSLEENGVHEGHHLHLRERPREPDHPPEGPSREQESPRSHGVKKAPVGEHDPVVGWLVCIDGTETGKDYRIRSGNNTIGRSPEMYISISGDDAISRDRHAVITFDPQSNSFHFRPGEGRGLVYVNEKAVLGTAQLHPFDEIQVGNTKMLFVPFCGERFIWVKKVKNAG